MSLNRAIQRDLDKFFTKLDSSSYTIRKATKEALSQSCSKLNEQGFIRLNKVATDTFYQSGVAKLWKGHRLLGVDGTRLVLPNHATEKKEFGTCKFGSKAESERSLAIASTLFDALNQLTLDGRLSPYKEANGKKAGERALLKQHFKELYHLRWNQGEAYKPLKSRIELKDFSGKTANAVKQDFYAKIFLMTLTAAYAHPVGERVRQEYKADKHRKYGQK